MVGLSPLHGSEPADNGSSAFLLPPEWGKQAMNSRAPWMEFLPSLFEYSLWRAIQSIERGLERALLLNNERVSPGPY